MAYCVVLMSAPSAEAAEKLAVMLVESRLAACVSQVPGMRSVYWWKGKLERGEEVLLVAKTSKTKVKELVKAVKREHSDMVPEILALPVKAGNRDYLRWMDEALKGPRAGAKEA